MGHGKHLQSRRRVPHYSQARACDMGEKFRSNRLFRFWEAVVSHDEMLIRGHRLATDEDDGKPANVDIIFSGVKYLNIPTMFKGLEIDDPTDEEVETARAEEDSRSFKPSWVHILVINEKRYMIVAPYMLVHENNWSNMESHFYQRIRYRGLRPQEPVRSAQITANFSEGPTELVGKIIANSEREYLIALDKPVAADDGLKEFVFADLEKAPRRRVGAEVACKLLFMRESDFVTPYQDRALRLASTRYKAHNGRPPIGGSIRVQGD